MKILMTAAFAGALMLLASGEAGAVTAPKLSTLSLTAQQGSVVAKTGWHRRCWWRHGRRFCHRW